MVFLNLLSLRGTPQFWHLCTFSNSDMELDIGIASRKLGNGLMGRFVAQKKVHECRYLRQESQSIVAVPFSSTLAASSTFNEMGNHKIYEYLFALPRDYEYFLGGG